MNFLICLIILFGAIFALGIYHQTATRDDLKAFADQNRSAIAAGDALALTSQLEALSLFHPRSCIVGLKRGTVFYTTQGDRCTTQDWYFLSADSAVNHPGSRVTVRIESPLDPVFFGLGMSLAAALCALVTIAMIAARRFERIHSDHKHAIAYQELQSQAYLARMVQIVAHDVRKPFSLIKVGLAQMLRLDANPQVLTAYAQRLQEHVGSALLQVEGMLQDILSSGVTTIVDPTPVDPVELVATALVDVFGSQHAASTQLIVNFSHTQALLVDEQRVRRVFVNIIDNARQAMKNKGKLTISTQDGHLSDGRPAVRVVFHNTDSFIPVIDRDKIFDPYFSRGKKDGTGLGLLVARRVVVAHGGSIDCDSCEINGTTFSLVLPASEALATQLRTDTKSSPGMWRDAQEVRRYFLAVLASSREDLLNRTDEPHS